MTLTEFLLARIDEDEASTANASEVGVQYKVKSHGNGLHDLWDDDWLGGLRIDTTRLLAECEAKRRILKRCRESNGYWGAEVEAMMAAIYADHPDYDEAWRVAV